MSGLFGAGTVALVNTEDRDDVVSNRRKRVDFQTVTTEIDEAGLLTPHSEVAPALRPIPRSRDSYLKSRPILKTSISNDSVIQVIQETAPPDISAAMDSLLSNLTKDERSESVDAYQTMTALMKMYEEPPEPSNLKNKIVQLQRCWKRDLAVLDNLPDECSSEERLSKQNLVLSALKLLITMIWSSTFAECLTDEFRVWILQKAIYILERHTAPKPVITHVIHLLAMQNFKPSLLSQGNRAVRILETLEQIADHVVGKSINIERQLVYTRLTEQCEIVMRAKVDLWVKPFLSALCHSFKGVRNAALNFGVKACTTFVGNHSIAPAMRAALAAVKDKHNWSTSITRRLEKLLSDKTEGEHVPQIWACMLLLTCNDTRYPVDTWSELHAWMQLLQKCFNSSNSALKFESFTAWNRLYYVARPGSCSDKMLQLLGKPAISQLEKTSTGSSSRAIRQTIIYSYYMLLYYAFPPALEHSRISRNWNEYITKTFRSGFFAKSSANCDLACRVLSKLFYNTSQRHNIWESERALQSSVIESEELPTLDSRWIRAHIVSILGIVKHIVEHASFGTDDSSEAAYASQMWQNLLRAVRESGNKEVIPSAATISALQALQNFLQNDVQRETRARTLRQIAVKELGNTFEVFSSTSLETAGIMDPPVSGTKKQRIPLLRHDDSQVAFVKVDSPKQRSLEFESQLLTTNQKDVSARQKTEPVITFADVKSSQVVVASSKKGRSARLGSSDSPVRPATPILHRTTEIYEEQLISTPTPQRRRTQSQNLQPEIPSSPLSENGRFRSQPCQPITSSPLKQTEKTAADDDDVVRLSEVEETPAVLEASALTDSHEAEAIEVDRAAIEAPSSPKNLFRNQDAVTNVTRTTDELFGSSSTAQRPSNLRREICDTTLPEGGSESLSFNESSSTTNIFQSAVQEAIDPADGERRTSARRSQTSSDISLASLIIGKRKRDEERDETTELSPARPTPHKRQRGRPRKSQPAIQPASVRKSSRPRKSLVSVDLSKVRPDTPDVTEEDVSSQMTESFVTVESAPTTPSTAQSLSQSSIKDSRRRSGRLRKATSKSQSTSSNSDSRPNQIFSYVENVTIAPVLPVREREAEPQKSADLATKNVSHEASFCDATREALEAQLQLSALENIDLDSDLAGDSTQPPPNTKSQKEFRTVEIQMVDAQTQTSLKVNIEEELERILSYMNSSVYEPLRQEMDLANLHRLCFGIGLRAHELMGKE